MPCYFCIAAVAIAATVLIPALVDSMDEQLRAAAADLRRVKDTGSVAMWTGTFTFTAGSGEQKRATANVTLYKTSRRARIQATTHELDHGDMHRLQDTIAGLLGATVISRQDGPGQSATAPTEHATSDPAKMRDALPGPPRPSDAGR